MEIYQDWKSLAGEMPGLSVKLLKFKYAQRVE